MGYSGLSVFEGCKEFVGPSSEGVSWGPSQTSLEVVSRGSSKAKKVQTLEIVCQSWFQTLK